MGAHRQPGWRSVNVSRAELNRDTRGRLRPGGLQPSGQPGERLVCAGILNGKSAPSLVWKTAMGGDVQPHDSPGASSLSRHALCIEGPLPHVGILGYSTATGRVSHRTTAIAISNSVRQVTPLVKDFFPCCGASTCRNRSLDSEGGIGHSVAYSARCCEIARRKWAPRTCVWGAHLVR